MYTKYMLLSALLALNVIIIGVHCETKGAIGLDSLTFDKVASKFKASLIRFDTAYPYGEKQDEWVKVAADLRATPDLLVADVGVRDYGEKENQDLADRYAITKDDFPAVRLFLNGDLDKPVLFEDKDFKADRIKAFVRSKAAIKLLLESCLEEFDALAAKFTKDKATKEQQKKVFESAKKKAEALTKEADKKSANIYVKVMEKALERGVVFYESEKQRVANLLAGKLSDAKKKELQGRLNIIESFVAAGAAKDEL